jgi:hypothetical protein
MVTRIKKAPDFKTNPKYYTDLLGSRNLMTALEKAESLQASATVRQTMLRSSITN